MRDIIQVKPSPYGKQKYEKKIAFYFPKKQIFVTPQTRFTLVFKSCTLNVVLHVYSKCWDKMNPTLLVGNRS